MRWLERIHVRAFSKEARDKLLDALQQLELILIDEGLVEMKILSSINIENDLVIALKWQGDLPEGGKSQLGMELLSMLPEYGVFNNSSWEFI